MHVYTPSKTYQTFLKAHLPEDITLCDDPNKADVFITGNFSKDDGSENLKAVIIPFAGHNGIDLDAIESRGIKLFNTQAHAVYVAEKALKLTLGIMGNVQIYHENLRQKHWSNRHSNKRIPWTTLVNKRVGIYGFGAIGKHFKRFIEPFECTINVIDRGKDYGDAIARKDIYDLTANSDVIVIAAPLLNSTLDAFDDSVLKTMQDKFLINVGRGPIINEDALYHRLSDGTLKGFASDVWYQYPKKDEPVAPSKHPIHELKNVLLSPHFGGFNDQAQKKMRHQVLETLIKLSEGDDSDALNIDKLRQ